MDDIAAKLEKSKIYREVDLIFVNALFDAGSGYNALKSRDEKLMRFNKALEGMNKQFSPDLIFVACNTLSVLINDTEFVRKEGSPPLISIVDSGLDLISAKLMEDKNSSVIIFGTETTIEEDTHRSELLARGYDAERIVTMACPQLQSYIEQDPEGEETEMLIEIYLSEAFNKLKKPQNLTHISLNCSHFGYSERLWDKALRLYAEKPGSILNPNFVMGDILFKGKPPGAYTETIINFQVVSMVELTGLQAVKNLFSSKSQAMVEALENYSLIPGLF